MHPSALPLGPSPADARYGIPDVGRPDRLLPRARIIEHLRTDPGPIIVVEGTAGSGKTTLLATWAQTDDRATAWLTLGPAHADPAYLVADVARVLARIHPSGPLSTIPRRVGGPDVLRSLSRLTKALADATDATLLVLDDVHRVHDQRALDVVVTLADRFPANSRIAFAARSHPRLPVARWQLAGKVLVIDRSDLDLDTAECATLLRTLGVAEADALAPSVHRQTEGWVAGIHLLGLSHRHVPGPGLTRRHGIEPYLQDEILGQLDPETRTMLVRTSVAEVVTGPLADALSGLSDSADRLARLADEGLLVVPLDRQLGSYRYHSLLRDVLLQELRRQPTVELECRSRAADWYERAGMLDDAIEQTIAGHDLDRAERLVIAVAQQKYRIGEVVTLFRWIEAFDDAELRRRPDLAALAALVNALEGEPAPAAHWAHIAATPGVVDRAPGVVDPRAPGPTLVAAMLCERGPEAMAADAVATLAEHDEAWTWRTTAVYAAGMAELMLGRGDAAMARFEEVERLHGIRQAQVRLAARAERAMAHIGRRRWAAARSILDLDREAVLADPESGRISGLLWLVADARMALQRGDRASVEDRTRRLQVGRVRLTWGLPWLAVRVLTELARLQSLMGDHQGVRATLAEARDAMAVRPVLGILGAELERIWEQTLVAPVGSDSWTTLSRAELRLLPWLQTHLTIKQIGQRLGVSHHTAKSQALSIYAKLGVSTRSGAVEAAVASGLLEDTLA